MSKRKLLKLVKEGYVNGWDDPRMPTLSGMRRRGYTPNAIRKFLEIIGVAKNDSLIDIALLEHCLREDLNKNVLRRMAVLRPLKLIIDNYSSDVVEEMEAINNPEDPRAGIRRIPFSKELYIEKDDFREIPPQKYYRLSPGTEIRLRYAYFIKCTDLIKDEKTGEVTEVHCTYDPTTRGGDAPDGRKVKSTIHWVSAAHALKAGVYLFDHLFTKENPDDTEEGEDFMDYINPNSLEVLTKCFVEPSLANAIPGSVYQFERQGYFCLDPDTTDNTMLFNRTVPLRDTWAKIEKTLNP
jgi:glutaminyl-tRNA synthetase